MQRILWFLVFCIFVSLYAMVPFENKKHTVPPRNKTHHDSPLLKKKKSKKRNSTLQTIQSDQEQIKVDLKKLKQDVNDLSTNLNRLVGLTTTLVKQLKDDPGYDADIEHSAV